MLEPFLLVAASALFGLLFLLIALFRAIFRSEKVGFWSTTFAFISAGLALVALVMNHTDPAETQPLVDAAALVIGIVLAAVGVLVIVLELIRPPRLKASRGMMALWTGFLILISTFLVPQLARQMQFTPPTPVFIAAEGTPVTRSAAQADTTGEAQPTDEPTSTPTPTATATRTPTETRTPRPTDTATATRERFTYATRTPEPTATVANPCLVLVKYNLRLRAAPNGEAETILVIPYDTNVTAYGRNEAATWWYVTHEDEWGWIDGEFVDVSSACADLPEVDA